VGARRVAVPAESRLRDDLSARASQKSGYRTVAQTPPDHL